MSAVSGRLGLIMLVLATTIGPPGCDSHVPPPPIPKGGASTNIVLTDSMSRFPPLTLTQAVCAGDGSGFVVEFDLPPSFATLMSLDPGPWSFNIIISQEPQPPSYQVLISSRVPAQSQYWEGTVHLPQDEWDSGDLPGTVMSSYVDTRAKGFISARGTWACR
jgi:hypothetical protein